MIRKNLLPTLISAVFAAFAIILVVIPQKQPQPRTPEKTNQSPSSQVSAVSDKDEALKNALNLYIKKKQVGTDFSNGPCLGKIADDWVLDIAHDPRQEVDDKSENQCEDFRQGKVHHVIELDPDGKLIRSQ